MCSDILDLHETPTKDAIGVHQGFSKCLEDLLWHKGWYDQQLAHMEAINAELLNEHFKDEQLAAMQQTLECMQADYNRGFPISETEQNAIRSWKQAHLEECHPSAVDDPTLRGAIDGNFTYSFVPTSLGTLGKVRCTCGAELTFRFFD